MNKPAAAQPRTQRYRVTLSLDVEVEAADKYAARERAIELAWQGTFDESFRRDSGATSVEQIEAPE